MKPINPEWDRRWMNSLAGGEADLQSLCEITEQSIEEQAGLSAHESKTWLVARSALPTDRPLASTLNYYQEIPEYIAGFGAMLLKA